MKNLIALLGNMTHKLEINTNTNQSHDNKDGVHHPKLIEGWSFPDLPKGCREVTVTLMGSGNVHLNFVFPTERSAKKYRMKYGHTPKVRWPWNDGFYPSREDWEQIGFTVFGGIDNCFGGPNPDEMFSDWIDHPAHRN